MRTSWGATRVGQVRGPVSNEERDEASIHVCAGPRGGWAERWPHLVHLSS